LVWGKPSYEVCHCCGFEFGFDDEPESGVVGSSFEESRREWIAGGCVWFYPELQPADWSLSAQLETAGIKNP
jgi:hypothetical protein